MINLDTHVLIFALRGDVTVKEYRVLAANSWSVSAIVFWELAKLVQLGRLDMDLENGEVVARCLRSSLSGSTAHLGSCAAVSVLVHDAS